MKKKSYSIKEPETIGRSTYFWNPCVTTKNRRKREKMMHYNVRVYLRKIGLNPITKYGSTIGNKYHSKFGQIEVKFHYKEGSKNVKKSFNVLKNGKKSTIATLRKFYP